MVTVEVDLKEGDEEPEQHLDDGEHIERVVVPISELYEKLQGKQHQPQSIPLSARPAETNPICAAGGDGNITFPHSNVQRARKDRRRQVSYLPISNLTSAYETSFLTHNEQALPLGSRSPLEPTSSLRLTCLLARFCRLRGERLYQRSVRCFSGLGLEMGRWSCRCCCEVRIATRRQSVQVVVVSVAVEVHRMSELTVLLGMSCERLVGRIESCSVSTFSRAIPQGFKRSSNGDTKPKTKGTAFKCGVCTFDAAVRRESMTMPS
jgi:hypothetical protein